MILLRICRRSRKGDLNLGCYEYTVYTGYINNAGVQASSRLCDCAACDDGS